MVLHLHGLSSAFVIECLVEKLPLLLEIIISGLCSSKGIYTAHIYCFISSFCLPLGRTNFYCNCFLVFEEVRPAEVVSVKVESAQVELC